MDSSHQPYLASSIMLDFQHADIQQLIDQQGWRRLSPFDAVGSIYDYVRNEIKFGYNADDRLPASRVLRDGYGQCNTKGTLLMALLRAVGVATRIHGFTIFNELQRGAIPNYLFAVAPERILHSWVEVYFEGRWLNLEGYIIDRPYLNKVQQSVGETCQAFSGYGIATRCLSSPQVEWQGEDTYIQSEGIADDFGTFTTPDNFYQAHGSNLSGVKKILFRYLLRHLMNLNVSRIRNRGFAKKQIALRSSQRSSGKKERPESNYSARHSQS